MEYEDDDVVLESADGYVVVKHAAGICAARLRVSEKKFVADHAQLLQKEPWFKELTPEDWCQTVGVITVKAGHAVNAIRTVVSGKLAEHFTLPLVHTKARNIAGYVQAVHTPEDKELAIAHVKVDSAHMGKGLGGLLIDQRTTTVEVGAARERVCRCSKLMLEQYDATRLLSSILPLLHSL
eukprot:Skav228789  [mRNA]  locus=scaffold589:707300:707842:- [translate_table: standard]